MTGSIIPLKCYCNNYSWGKKGRASLVARLCEKRNPDFKIDDKEYAEMWMGTYPTLPSYDARTSWPLQDVLNENSEKLIGKHALDKFGSDLPFLPKILSIAKALPLQIHPNIKLAEELHNENPEKFTDPNHKPEIAVALSKFEAFVGFKPLDEIKDLLALEPLEQFLPSPSKTKAKSDPHFSDATLRHVIKAMLNASEQQTRTVLNKLHTISPQKFANQAYILKLLPRLEDQYSQDDSGILVALICMNYLILEPGDSIFVPADGIHAYLSGDIVECMARSNNVLNTGFCPRLDRDSVDLFVQSLTFEQHDKQSPVLKPEKSDKSLDGKTVVLRPPLSEFNMLVTEMKSGDVERVKAIDGPSVIVIMKGSGQLVGDGEEFEIGEGSVYFIRQGVEIEVVAREPLAAYRAFAD
ncbi:mannose-6-phosphate isomerase, class I [Rhinocladiella mackenziei CBS 650.93]|uniref:Mannose-6-phosphate isomerase n=1 Tax=Rhinocladiella mackenziei CBS 650.93 TaxID=1442369 RepID=A0A0D2J032_9EURO|nr:mannose-6-phosphate isomerase, class I [Rhinocladiella mackenziei CBS 650.93]KIX02250.1 mannose-6-phosphate isomerase, class I [Rhinocladiella mackenziei CBS 650.93]